MTVEPISFSTQCMFYLFRPKSKFTLVSVDLVMDRKKSIKLAFGVLIDYMESRIEVENKEMHVKSFVFSYQVLSVKCSSAGLSNSRAPSGLSNTFFIWPSHVFFSIRKGLSINRNQIRFT